MLQTESHWMVVTGHSFLKWSTKAAKCTSPEGQLLGWQRFELSLRHTFLPKKVLKDFGGGFHLESAQSWPRPMEWFCSQNINSYRARKLKTANSKCLRRLEHAKQSVIHVTWIRLLLIYHVQNHTALLKECPTGHHLRLLRAHVKIKFCSDPWGWGFFQHRFIPHR